MDQQQHASISSKPFSSMDSHTRFEPPDKVIAPAFAELLNRLHRVRTSGTPPSQELLNDERVLFNYGVAQRRRVLEHTVGLLFAQYLVYRQAVVKLTSSRPMRILYGTSSVIATTLFLRSRAAQVTNDLFAHIATQPTNSVLANEARIILAELEGPNGPYFQSICDKNNFQLPSDISGDSAQDNAQFAEDGGVVHPQFKLTPRLMSSESNQTSQSQNSNVHPRISRGKNRANTSKRTDNQDVDYIPQDRQSPRRPSAIRMRFPNANTNINSNDADPGLADLPLPSNEDRMSDTFSPPSSSSFGRDNEDASDNSVGDSSWGKPFDFAAMPDSSSSDDNTEGFSKDSLSSSSGGEDGDLSPSQKRAAERRRKREAARAARASPQGGASDFEE